MTPVETSGPQPRGSRPRGPPGGTQLLGRPVKRRPHAAHAPRGSLVAHDRRPMEDTERFTKDAHHA